MERVEKPKKLRSFFVEDILELNRNDKLCDETPADESAQQRRESKSKQDFFPSSFREDVSITSRLPKCSIAETKEQCTESLERKGESIFSFYPNVLFFPQTV